nr:hypothetical protein [Tanacetum cinerariifolium]
MHLLWPSFWIRHALFWIGHAIICSMTQVYLKFNKKNPVIQLRRKSLSARLQIMMAMREDSLSRRKSLSARLQIMMAMREDSLLFSGFTQ